MTAAHEGLGSAADEAARLADVLGGWFSSATADVQADHDDVTCTACPLCRGIAAVRSVNPEVVEHLSAAAGSLVAALRELRSPGPARDEGQA
ncbi:MAG: DUF5304 family protein [Rhodoferax sp.]|nr:DUF5304 family protein [Actinomycetota bacterium]